MIKMKVVSMLSILLLGFIIVATMQRSLMGGPTTPTTPEQPAREAAQINLLTVNNELVLKVVLQNLGKEVGEYRIEVSVDGVQSRDESILRAYATYSYTHHIYPQQLTDGVVAVTVYKRGESLPLDQMTYRVREGAS